MKKYLLLLLAILAFVPAMLADGPKDKAKMMEEIQQFKIDFLAKEMGLSEKEKATFSTLYKEYDNKRREAGKEAWKFERQLKKNKNATDDDYKKLAALEQTAREKGNEIEKEYDKKFSAFLSPKQIYQMHKGEEQFFAKMKEMRKKQKKAEMHKNRQGEK